MLHIAEGKNLFKVDGSNTIIDEWISVAGGINAVQAKGNMLEINAEEMPNINPDVIIIGRAKSPDAIEKIYENKAMLAQMLSKTKKSS